MKQAILIFAKNLIPGKVKTRLAATVGHEMAMAVYQKLLAHTATIINDLPADKILYYSDYIATDDDWNEVCSKRIQAGADLGERMLGAFTNAFNDGYQEVIIIGTDCYELNSEIISGAFDQLKEHDIVLGPALDGGYYLLGMKKLHAPLFEEISWSTRHVLQQTISRCAANYLHYKLLTPLPDIDNEADLNKIKTLLMAN